MLKKSHLNKNYVIFEKSNYSQPYISNKYLNQGKKLKLTIDFKVMSKFSNFIKVKYYYKKIIDLTILNSRNSIISNP